jgi:hypothetical protein
MRAKLSVASAKIAVISSGVIVRAAQVLEGGHAVAVAVGVGGTRSGMKKSNIIGKKYLI